MDVYIDATKMAMAILNGLPSHFKNIITTLNALEDDSKSFNLDTVDSRFLQEAQFPDISAKKHFESKLFPSSHPRTFGLKPLLCLLFHRRGHIEHR